MMGGASYHRKWDGYVCVDQIGDIINPKYISRYFADLLAKNNLRRIRFHDLRHSLLLRCCSKMEQRSSRCRSGWAITAMW